MRLSIRWIVTTAAGLVASKVDAQTAGRFAGRWEGAPEWGIIELRQTGARVEGTYTCCGVGTISGTVTGNTLRFHWANERGQGNAGEAVLRLTSATTAQGNWCDGTGCDPSSQNPFSVSLMAGGAVTAAAGAGGSGTGGRFQGQWDSEAWGVIDLKQAGNRAEGTYACCGGGIITGTVSGSTLTLHWRSGDGGSGVGEATFRLTSPNTAEGNWCEGVGCIPGIQNPYTATRRP